MKRVLPLLVAAAILLAACNDAEHVGGSPSDAIAIADDFLSALASHDADAAWSLIYPPNQSSRFGNDRTAFDELVERIDLSDVEWSITSAARNGNGRYWVQVSIDPADVDASLGVFIQVVATDGVATEGTMQVDIEPLFGQSGVPGG